MSKQNKIVFRFISEKGIAGSLPDSFLGQACIKRRAVWPGTYEGPTAQNRHPVPLHLARPLSRSSIHSAIFWRGVASPGNVVARGWVRGGWALVWQESLGDSQPGVAL